MQLKQNTILSILGLALLGFMACDKITEPFEEKTFFDSLLCGNLSETFDTNKTDYVQNVLIEDFTGQTCGNCPGAAVEAANIKKDYPEQVIITAVHAGDFAEPFNAGPKFREDYRTEAGEEYNVYFGINIKGNPNGVINREKRSGDQVISIPNWRSVAESMLSRSPEVGMQAIAVLDTAENSLCVSVLVKALKNITEQKALTIYLLEDSIVGDQKNYAAPNGDPNYPVADIDNYVHQHMLRDNINGTWGETWSTEAIASGAYKIFNYTYVLPAGNKWRKNHLEIVAYTYESNVSSEKHGEVRQAISTEVTLK